MNNSPLLSIIVPVYNVEQYLSKCVDSILSQTLKNFELILVDDGSTDNSGKICDEYSLIDQRVVSIHKINEGAWSARNTGLDVAKGKFIMFVDSDDVLGTKDTIEKNIKIICKYNTCCILQFPSQWYYGKDRHNMVKHNSDNYEKKDILDKFFNGIITNVLWDKIYDKRIFMGIRFPKMLYYEDAYFMIDILNNTKKIIISELGYYKYCIRESSAMTSKLTIIKLEDYFLVMDRLLGIAITLRNTQNYRIRLILNCIYKLSYGKDIITDYLLLKFSHLISKYIPDYLNIIKYLFSVNVKGGLKLLIIKIAGLKAFYKYFI